jgi:NAD(P)-dependent dehydrogenase (short-subunit alcohol dehydrogenase family)
MKRQLSILRWSPPTQVDVSDEAAVDSWFADCLANLGGLDVLINNAGIAGPMAPLEEIEP